MYPVLGLQLWILFAVDFVTADIENIGDWVRRAGYYYYFTEQRMPNGAATYCDNYGAKQLSITSAQEQNFTEEQTEAWPAPYWIGLTTENNCDNCKNGESSACNDCRNTWYWVDGSSSEYKNWVHNQPQGDDHVCARLQRDGKWKGAPCSGGAGYRNICKRQNQCDSSPCVRGACEMLLAPEKYRCNCPDGYQGADCGEEINECEPNPCRHGGTCLDKIASYECICPSTWTGPRCNTDVDECVDIPGICQNGGTCNNRNDGYTCDCAEGYEGTNCENDINECASDPCKNGATCVDKVNLFECTCTTHWIGTNCETDLDECSDTNKPEYCVHGFCINSRGSYNCSCEEGYEGEKCATAIPVKDPDSNDGDDNLQVLQMVFVIAASLFAITFVVMVVMAILDCRDVRRLKQEKAIRENRAKVDTKESNPLIDQQPSTSGAYANVSYNGDKSSANARMGQGSATDPTDFRANLDAMYANVEKAKYK